MAGTLAAHELPALPGPLWYAPLVLAALVALRDSRSWPVVAGIAGFVWTVYCAGERLEERLPAAALGRDFALSGWVDGFPNHRPGQVTFSFAAVARPPGVPARMRLTWYAPPLRVEPGMPLTLVARLRPPRGTRNPGGFDYERWLMAADYGATGYVRSGERDTVAHGGLPAAWLRHRAAIAGGLEAAAGSRDAAALTVALAIGERYLFEERHWSDFRRTGTSHLVAVSGLHVAMIGLAVFVVLRRAWLRLPGAWAAYDLEVAAAASAAATVWYAALTGFALPALRSLIMIVGALIVLTSRRRIGAFRGVAVALGLVLAADPFAPLSASFWLSYGAVALLIVLSAPQPLGTAAGGHPVRAPWRSAVELTRMQWSIGIALVPLGVAFFAEYSLIGPIANLAAIPWFNLVLVPLTLAAALAAPLPAVGPALVHAAGGLAAATVAVLHELAGLSWAALELARPAPWALALAGAGVLFAMAAPPVRGRALAWLTLAPLIHPASPRIPHGDAELVVLDVGHGLAVLVETRSHRLLFDAGARYPSGFDIGEEVVLPAIASRGRAGLDVLVVSHGDADHAGGAPAVVAAWPRATVLRGADVREPPGRACQAGERWSWDGVAFAIVHPGAGFAARGNDGSCVLSIAAAGGTALVTGDIEAAGERALVAAGGARADVVVVPHHGSATSSSSAFVDATGARWALVSAAHTNRWGFPRPQVRERWQDGGARLFVTGDDGALTVRLRADGVEVATERGRRRRYWDPR